jgi:hypothetical protein
MMAIQVRPVQSAVHSNGGSLTRTDYDPLPTSKCYSPPPKPPKSFSSSGRSRKDVRGSAHSVASAQTNNGNGSRNGLEAMNGFERMNSNEVLRRFGRPIDRSAEMDADDECSSMLPTKSYNNTSSPLLTTSSKMLTESIQCLPTSEECDDIPSHRDKKNGRTPNNFRQEKERFDGLTRKVVADFSAPDNSDYLTMKPIHRAKPFKATTDSSRNGSSEGVNLPVVPANSDRPPTPPQHRRPITEGSENTKLYDNPNDGDTLSNVTSNGLDE